jgi:RNA recognition motif. (a.k.a. RRM, RBD, or RNP domain)
VDVKRAQARGVAPPSIHQERPPFQQQQQQQQPVGPMLAPQMPVPGAGDSASQPQQPPPTSFFGGPGGAKPRSVFGQQPRDNELTPEQLHCKVFVGGIPHSVDRDELRRILSEYGTVVDSIIMVDQMTMRSRGFGFVTFSDAAGAERSIAAQPINIQGKMVEIKLATPRPERPPGDPSAAAAGVGGPKPFFQHPGGGGGAGAASAGYHQQYNKPGTYPNKFLGLRAGQAASNSEYAGFAVAYGRSGWKAGFGSRAFGRHGWDVHGWDDENDDDEIKNNGDENNKEPAKPKSTGFSFSMLNEENKEEEEKEEEKEESPSPKRQRQE